VLFFEFLIIGCPQTSRFVNLLQDPQDSCTGSQSINFQNGDNNALREVKTMARLFLLGVCLGFGGTVHAGDKQVSVHKTPAHGIQPQAVIDARGMLHLLYFEGEAKGGNLMYVRREGGKFAQPIRVNSQEGSAIATGTIRGGHIALGKNARLHVAWNGSSKAEPKNPIAGMPMMYARLNDAGNEFEPQRNLMTQTSVLDGGGSLAADQKGNVYVAWHALGKDASKGEDNRKLWVAISHDDGKAFAAEKSVWDERTGACGCCGIRGFADQNGNAYFLYRGASEKINRGMYVVRSADHGKSFAGLRLDNWKIDHCPMSSEAFAEGPTGVYAAWDTAGKVYFTRIQPVKLTTETPKAVPAQGDNAKHPALAVNKNADVIVVWTEETGWNRGGTLAWQVYDKNGALTSESGRRRGAIPVWGLPTVVAEPDGRFIIFH
jgi:hypothetical protein